MLRRIMCIAVLAVCGVAQLVAQQSPLPRPQTGLENLLRPNRRPPQAPATRQTVPVAVFDASNLGSPLKLGQNWRVGSTSNPEALSPSYDDSTWNVQDARQPAGPILNVDTPPSSPAQQGTAAGPRGGQRPYTWYRLHIKLAQNHAPVSLLVELPVAIDTTFGITSDEPGVDVYANGKLIHPEGPNGDHPEMFQAITRIYNLNVASGETSLVLAIRSVNFPAQAGFLATHKLLLGNSEDLQNSLELWTIHRLFDRLPRLINSILFAVLGLFLLALYFTQRGHIEYLWLALHELLQVPTGFVALAGSSAYLNNRWYWALSLQLLAASAYLYFEFLVAFLDQHKRWYIYLLRATAPILLTLGPVMFLHGRSWYVVAAWSICLLGCGLWLIDWFAFVIITLVASTMRRNFEAGLLLIPLLLTLVGWTEPFVMAGMSNWGGRGYPSPLTIHAGPIPIHFSIIADFAGLLVIVIIIFFRFLRIQHDQERVSSELEAARNVQELMIPQEKMDTPGFEVDAVYDPAHEVGGDFYHVQSAGEDGMLVVIGDVTGKGLKAAMNVSMLMGVLRHEIEKSPAKILGSLNRVLTGNESFTTCLAAWFGANGDLIMANAGHLPPYINGREVALAGSLPLGVQPQVNYEEIRMNLKPGDRILMLSDGVAEARSASGELFGFDRVLNLSNQSAASIALAAKSFGQEDDITVLTVRRQAHA